MATKVNSAYKFLLQEFTKSDAKEYEESLRFILGTKQGRCLLRHITELTHVYAQLNTEHLEYQAGVRNVGLQFLAECNSIAPELVLKALTERNKVMQERNERLKRTTRED